MPDGCHPVPGVGPHDAKIVIVGEALGENESIMGEPFVGRAGELLNKILKDCNLSRENNVYISNMVKCRPTKNNGKSNRPPTSDEIQSCKIWIWSELKKLQPKVIITLGAVASKTLLKLKPSTSMKSIVGIAKYVDYIGSTIVPCYHPSYLLQHGRDKLEETKEHFAFARSVLDEL